MSESPTAENWNDMVIRELRAGEQKIGGGRFDRESLLLLTTIGARSGQARISPLAYLPYENDVLVVGSAAGRDKHPAWYFNLLANPEVTVERWQAGVLESYQAHAHAASEGPEHAQLWKYVTDRAAGFADYQANTDRIIPVIRLSRS